MILSAIIIVLFQNIVCSNGARILAVVPSPSYSHQVVFQPIWKELSLRGHKVTSITTDPINDPSLTNLTEIDLHYIYNELKTEKNQVIENIKHSYLHLFLSMYQFMIQISDVEFQNPVLQNFMNDKNQHFDLVMVEFSSPIHIAFAEKFNCPIIAVISFDGFNQLHSYMGNPTHPILNPPTGVPFAGKLNFMERVTSCLLKLLIDGVYQYLTSDMQLMVNKHFGKSSSNLEDLMNKIDMAFINSDPILHPVRPLVPAVVQIGAGIHLKPPKPLPNDLQKYLDSASEGAIYFSLGSNAQSKDLTKNTLTILKQSFSKLPYKVLWKFEDHLEGKPDNVMITKWAPQQDVLRHPNIKLFISQCGLQSTDEGLHIGVPILAMPMFGDQPANARLLELKGVGFSVDHMAMTEEEFSNKILELIQNPKYRKQVEKLSSLIKDQPMTGLEKAVWWTEYVLRHKGAKHLRSPSLDVPAYQYYLLDVIGFCSLVIAVVVFIIYKIICLVCKLKCLFKNTNKVKTT